MADPIEYRKVRASFKLVFISVVILVILTYIGSMILALQPSLSDAGKSVVETSTTLSKMGFGAIIGLLGGKVFP